MRAPALLLLAAACTPDFASASDVTDLRVLAVQAEPPEPVFDPDGGTAPPVAVRVLAVDPSRDAGPDSMQLVVCGEADAGVCDTGPVADAGKVPLAFTLPPIDAAAFVGADKLAGYGGIRVTLSFSVDDGSPQGPVNGEKVLIYSPANASWIASPGCGPNQNPRIDSVQLTIDGGPEGLLLPGASLTPGIDYGLRPVLAADAGQQDYCALDLQGKLVHLTEQAHYAFFTTSGGSFDRDTADEPLDGGAPPDGLTRFKPSAADGGTIWIVVRDGRGGESWTTLPWTAK